MNQTIVRMKYGSQVYGTTVPTSDTDYRFIFIPDGYDLIMQRPAKNIGNSTKKSDVTRKNTSEDVDDEGFSIQTFFNLVRQGQTVAFEMLFTPKEYWTEWDARWDAIQVLRPQLVHGGIQAFVGYSKAQAAKFGAKGERLRALQKAVDVLSKLPPREQLSKHLSYIEAHILETNSPEFFIEHARGGYNYLTAANMRLDLSCSVGYSLGIYTNKLKQYGARAQLAARNKGIDWKATMHAVRIANEAEELLKTGHITFPRPEAELLLRIRKGELPYEEVSAMIDEGVEKVLRAQVVTELRKDPDVRLMDGIVYGAHIDALREE